MVNNAQNPVTDNVGTGADSQNQAGKWYLVVFHFKESHYYESSNDGHSQTSEPVFITKGGSIAKWITQRLREWSKDETLYSCEERGMSGYGVSCTGVELTLLTPDGKKITGFKPKSIAYLFS